MYFYLKIYKSENQPSFHSYLDSLERKFTHIHYIHPVSALYNMVATNYLWLFKMQLKLKKIKNISFFTVVTLCQEFSSDMASGHHIGWYRPRLKNSCSSWCHGASQSSGFGLTAIDLSEVKNIFFHLPFLSEIPQFDFVSS